MTDNSAETLRRRSQALIVIVGYPESGWSVTARREPSGALLTASGHTIDAACADMLVKLDEEPAKPRLKLKR